MTDQEQLDIARWNSFRDALMEVKRFLHKMGFHDLKHDTSPLKLVEQMIADHDRTKPQRSGGMTNTGEIEKLKSALLVAADALRAATHALDGAASAVIDHDNGEARAAHDAAIAAREAHGAAVRAAAGRLP